MELKKVLPNQLKIAIQENWPLLIPAGCIEYHGPYLPLGTDSIIVEELCYRIAKRIDCIVAPTFYYGPTGYAVSGPEKGTIDIYQMHDVTRPGEFERLMNNGVFDELKKAQKAGKVKFIGISTHAKAEDMKKMITCGEFDVITLSYNLIRYQRQVTDGEDISITEKEILPLAKEKGLGVTIMKPFGGGILAKNPLSGEASISPVQALKFVISNPYVDTITPGIGNLRELEEDIKAGDPNILFRN